jgi:UDPglucose 6-dehydrogenase
MRAGIVGQGYVGSAIREGIKSYYDVSTFDLVKELSTCKTLPDMVSQSDIIFVCVPTPMRSSGECVTSIVSSVVHDIDDINISLGKDDKTVVIKSTVPPGTTDRLNQECGSLLCVFSPEFLTEANSFDDFKNQSRIIIGGPRPASSRVKTFFRRVFPSIPIIKTGAAHAEMVKYFTNCFLSTKVSFANEMYQICETLGLDYDKVCEYSMYDERIGKTHLSVPGPDGKLGFGGHCLPKDLSAIRFLSKSLGVDTHVLDAVWNRNLISRGVDDRDWLSMKGRAVIDDQDNNEN